MFFLRVVGVWGGGGEKEREGGREEGERETESREREGGGRKRWVVCEAKQDGGVLKRLSQSSGRFFKKCSQTRTRPN